MLYSIYMRSTELFGTGQAEIEKFKMKINDSSGTEPTPLHATIGESALLTARSRWLDIKWSIYRVTSPGTRVE